MCVTHQILLFSVKEKSSWINEISALFYLSHSTFSRWNFPFGRPNDDSKPKESLAHGIIYTALGNVMTCFKDVPNYSCNSSTLKFVCKQEHLQKIEGKILRQPELFTEICVWPAGGQNATLGIGGINSNATISRSLPSHMAAPELSKSLKKNRSLNKSFWMKRHTKSLKLISGFCGGFWPMV
jgi:hypothetical protein